MLFNLRFRVCGLDRPRVAPLSFAHRPHEPMIGRGPARAAPRRPRRGCPAECDWRMDWRARYASRRGVDEVVLRRSRRDWRSRLQRPERAQRPDTGAFGPNHRVQARRTTDVVIPCPTKNAQPKSTVSWTLANGMTRQTRWRCGGRCGGRCGERCGGRMIRQARGPRISDIADLRALWWALTGPERQGRARAPRSGCQESCEQRMGAVRALSESGALGRRD